MATWDRRHRMSTLLADGDPRKPTSMTVQSLCGNVEAKNLPLLKIGRFSGLPSKPKCQPCVNGGRLDQKIDYRRDNTWDEYTAALSAQAYHRRLWDSMALARITARHGGRIRRRVLWRVFQDEERIIGRTQFATITARAITFGFLQPDGRFWVRLA